MKISLWSTFQRPDGKSFEDTVRTAISQFETLGCDDIAEACNKEREHHWKEALKLSPEDKYLGKYKAKVWVKELASPFQLALPTDLNVTILHDVPALYQDRAGVLVFFQKFHRTGNHWQTIPEHGKDSLSSSVWHELLHVCGDNENDGSIRHGYCGARVIEILVKGKGL